ncbi:MAG: antibiotic biosynthesis monooxygenase [Myxococcales bacterium]|jgi:quinol monooxygenase YgiN
MTEHAISEIRSDRDHVVLLNVFEVRPDRAQDLLDTLARATEEVMKDRPGFISASFHRSLDGKSVVNYAQWASVEDFEAMRADPACQEHMQACAALCERFTPRLLKLESVHALG